MNFSQTTSLSLLIVSFSALPATAALSGDSGSDEVSIESVANGTALKPLDKLLGGGNHSDLFESVLKQHASAAQPAKSMMDGHFGSAGAEHPVEFGQNSPASQTMPPAPPTAAAEAPNLSLTAAVHMGGGEQADTSSAPVSTASSNAPSNSGSIVTTNVTPTTPITPDPTAAPVPLPAAGLLFASGLFGLPVMRRLRKD